MEELKLFINILAVISLAMSILYTYVSMTKKMSKIARTMGLLMSIPTLIISLYILAGV